MAEREVGSSGEGNYIAVNGIEMYYEDLGVGNPLVLLHGGTATALLNWEEYLTTFSKEFRVIAPDCRGHGKTNNPSGEWSYRVMADDIAALIAELDLKKPNICGWSDGGQMAVELAMRYPGLANAYIVGAVLKDFSDVYLQSLREWGFEGPGEVDINRMEKGTPEYVEYLRSIHSPQGAEYWKELLNGLSIMWYTPLNYTDDDFSNISEPMLITIGDRDQIIPVEHSAAMYRLVPNAELAVLPNADHSLPRTKVKPFADILLEFLKRHNSGNLSP